MATSDSLVKFEDQISSILEVLGLDIEDVDEIKLNQIAEVLEDIETSVEESDYKYFMTMDSDLYGKKVADYERYNY